MVGEILSDKALILYILKFLSMFETCSFGGLTPPPPLTVGETRAPDNIGRWMRYDRRRRRDTTTVRVTRIFENVRGKNRLTSVSLRFVDPDPPASFHLSGLFVGLQASSLDKILFIVISFHGSAE